MSSFHSKYAAKYLKEIAEEERLKEEERKSAEDTHNALLFYVGLLAFTPLCLIVAGLICNLFQEEQRMRKFFGYCGPTILLAIFCYFIGKITKTPIDWGGFGLIWFLNVMLYLPFDDVADRQKKQ